MTDLKLEYTALATDYDGTLAEDGAVSARTLAALGRARELGRKLVLVTGRELNELLTVFPEIAAFDSVIAENGAVLYTPCPAPGQPQLRLLASAPPPAFHERLVARGVGPIAIGRVIVATWEPHQDAVAETIREMGLDLEVIFNKGAVMVLPNGINKASGLQVALAELGLDASKVIGVGDGENDHSLLGACGLGVAVANAVPSLKERADLVTTGPRGEGVVELLERMFVNDLVARVLPPPTPEAPVVTQAEVLAEQRPDAGASPRP